MYLEARCKNAVCDDWLNCSVRLFDIVPLHLVYFSELFSDVSWYRGLGGIHCKIISEKRMNHGTYNPVTRSDWTFIEMQNCTVLREKSGRYSGLRREKVISGSCAVTRSLVILCKFRVANFFPRKQCKIYYGNAVNFYVTKRFCFRKFDTDIIYRSFALKTMQITR